jgi:hypothetical protein
MDGSKCVSQNGLSAAAKDISSAREEAELVLCHLMSGAYPSLLPLQYIVAMYHTFFELIYPLQLKHRRTIATAHMWSQRLKAMVNMHPTLIPHIPRQHIRRFLRLREL